MISIAIHTYFGTMEMGAARVIPCLGSVETWRKAVEWREQVGRPALSTVEGRSMTCDVVLANPPCSRFSCMSSSAYGADKYVDLQTYPELLDVIELTKATGARVMWWETGPLAWSQSAAITAAVNKMLGWEHSTIIKHDPRSVGVPQRRVRCHVVHSREPIITRMGFVWDPPSAREFCVRDPESECQIREQEWNFPPSLHVPLRDMVQTFRANVPRLIEDDSCSAPVVLSGRLLGWRQQDRWATAEELARLMGAPPEEMKLLKNQWERLTALSKGVCADVAADVARRIILPTLEQRGLELVGPTPERLDWTRRDSYYDGVDEARRRERDAATPSAGENS